MFKSVLCLFALAMMLNANEPDLQKEDQAPPSIYKENICDEKYDKCAIKCEDSSITDITKCFAQCEMIYEQCEQKEAAKQN